MHRRKHIGVLPTRCALCIACIGLGLTASHPAGLSLGQLCPIPETHPAPPLAPRHSEGNNRCSCLGGGKYAAGEMVRQGDTCLFYSFIWSEAGPELDEATAVLGGENTAAPRSHGPPLRSRAARSTHRPRRRSRARRSSPYGRLRSRSGRAFQLRHSSCILQGRGEHWRLDPCCSSASSATT